MIMELRHLRYFAAVAEERHFGRAAHRLGIGQPPLSQQIQALERELGAQLFRRVPRNIELTAAGKVLFEDARGILARADQAVRDVERAGRGELGNLSVGFTSASFFSPCVPSSIRAFHETYPTVSLTLRETDSVSLSQDLADGKIDLAFIRPPASEPDRLTLTVVFEEDMLVVLPARHALAALAAVPLRALANEPFVLYPRHLGPSVVDAIFASCRGAGFAPRIVQEAPQVSSTINLVAAGLGVSMVPASMRQIQADGVIYRPIQGDAPRAVLALAARRGETATLVRNFIRLVPAATAQAQSATIRLAAATRAA
jgi:DNA-binding transcriptional LysR family regulator